MKHLKNINELYKKTYSKAADVLKQKHPTRSAELDRWAEEKGESEKMDKDFYHPFSFKNNPIIKDISSDKFWRGNFYITIADKPNGGWAQGYSGFEVFMTSEFGNEIYIQCSYDTKGEDYFNMNLFWGSYQRPHFTFDNRKDALEFRKYLVEDVAEDLNLKQYLCDEVGGKVVPSKRLSINNLYSTK